MANAKEIKKSAKKLGYVVVTIVLGVAAVWYFPWTAAGIGLTAAVAIIVAAALPKDTHTPLRPKTPSKRVAKALAEKGEQVLWESRKHPLILWRWWLGMVSLPCILIHIGRATDIPWRFLLAAAGVGVVALAIRIWLWYVDRICITNKRVLSVTGILLIDQSTMPLSKLTDLKVIFTRSSTILAGVKLIREPYATLIVESAGQDQALRVIDYVPCGQQVNRLTVGQVL